MEYATFPVPNAAGNSALSISTTSAQTAVLKGANYYVVSTTLCFVLRGSNPTATNACMPLVANVPHVLMGIQEGEKLAFLAASGTGTVYYQPLP